MLPIEYELKWERVWIDVMLDAARTVQKEIGVPGDLQRLQDGSREILRGHYEAHEFGVASGPLCSKLSTVLRSVFNENDVLRFYLWGDYLSGQVESRVGEFFWFSVLYGLDEVPHASWIAEAAARLRDDLAPLHEHHEGKLNALTFTEWDRFLLELADISEEGQLAAFKNAAWLNLFDRVWHQRMGHMTIPQLEELLIVGKSLAQKREVPETSVCFPGIWEAGPQRLVLNLCSS
jgi:hypothetical protein